MDRDRQQRVPGALAERLFVSVNRFRTGWDRHRRPEDLRQLIRIFPNVTIVEGYLLDYLPMGGTRSRWIWPFVRINAAQDEIPELLKDIPRDQLVNMRGSPNARHIEIQTLYRYLRYPLTPVGLFEYAFFVTELWATKSECQAQQWLTIRPIFSRHAFENQLRKEGGSVRKITRPEVFEPMTLLSPSGGGEVSFLAYESGAWRRIFMMELRIDHNGHVHNESGKVFVDLA